MNVALISSIDINPRSHVVVIGTHSKIKPRAPYSDKISVTRLARYTFCDQTKRMILLLS